MKKSFSMIVLSAVVLTFAVHTANGQQSSGAIKLTRLDGMKANVKRGGWELFSKELAAFMVGENMAHAAFKNVSPNPKNRDTTMNTLMHISLGVRLNILTSDEKWSLPKYSVNMSKNRDNLVEFLMKQDGYADRTQQRIKKLHGDRVASFCSMAIAMQVAIAGYEDKPSPVTKQMIEYIKDDMKYCGVPKDYCADFLNNLERENNRTGVYASYKRLFNNFQRDLKFKR